MSRGPGGAAAGGPDPAVDMQLPETFHRVKRALLLNCSALVLLFFAEKSDDTGFLGLSIQVAPSVLQWLALAAAVYYFTGFLFEFQNARHLNSRFVKAQSAAGIDEALTALVNNLTLRASDWPPRDLDRTATKANELIQAVGHLNGEPLARELARIADAEVGHAAGRVTASISAAEHEADVRKAMNAAVAAFEQAEKSRMAKMSTYASELQTVTATIDAQISGATKSLQDVVAMAAKFSADVRALRRDLTGARTTSFWVWEGAATGLFFIMAGGMTLWSLAPQYVDALPAPGTLVIWAAAATCLV